MRTAARRRRTTGPVRAEGKVVLDWQARGHSPKLGSLAEMRAVVGDLELQRRIGLLTVQTGVHGTAAGGVQERGRIATVHDPRGVVDMGSGVSPTGG